MTPIFGLLAHLGAIGAQNGARAIFGLRLVNLKRPGRRLEGRVQSLAVEHQIRPKVARAHRGMPHRPERRVQRFHSRVGEHKQWRFVGKGDAGSTRLLDLARRGRAVVSTCMLLIVTWRVPRRQRRPSGGCTCRHVPLGRNCRADAVPDEAALDFECLREPLRDECAAAVDGVTVFATHVERAAHLRTTPNAQRQHQRWP